MIDILDVFYSFRDGQNVIPALNGVSLHVRKGEWLALTGPNGSGKSTLVRLMNGLLLPHAGEVRAAGCSLYEPGGRRQVKERIQIVFQNPSSQMIGSNPLEDVSFGLESRGIGRDEMLARIHAALEQVGLSHKLFDNTATLSGGQKQRLAIASCLALQPDCIIFDEATSMLDPVGRRQVFEIARSLWQQGTTVIWVTQRLQELLAADRVAVMDEGQIIFDGDARQLFYGSEIPVQLKWELPPLAKIGLYLKEAGIPIRNLPLTEDSLEGLLCASNYHA